jgi:hypothetical protein
MAVACVDEAMRNVVALGADPERVALLDNFCWGNPRLPDRLASLVRAAEGCYDAAVAYDVPFVSGKDSLNNEYVGPDGAMNSIPPTLLISAIGIVPDAGQAVTMDFKAPGNFVYVLGVTRRVRREPLCAGARVTWRGAATRGGRSNDHACAALVDGEWAGAGVSRLAARAAWRWRWRRWRYRADWRRRRSGVHTRRGDGRWCAGLLFAESNARFVVEVSPADAVVRSRRPWRALSVLSLMVAPGATFVLRAGATTLLVVAVEQLRGAWQG